MVNSTVSLSSRTITLSFLIRRRENMTTMIANEFQERILLEKATDPADIWIKDSLNAASFTMGNLVNILDRP